MQYGNAARYSKIVRYLESPCDDKKRVSARRELETQTDQVCFKKNIRSGILQPLEGNDKTIET